MTIYAGTGHRPEKIGGYDEQTSRRLVRFARDWIAMAAPSHIISGMAVGWDMTLAHAAVLEGVPFTAAIPFAGQEQRWPEASQRRWDALVRRAAAVEIVSSGGFSAQAMQRRNEWMVDRADRIVALFDGSSGGTANCIVYAQRVGKPVRNLWSQWKATVPA